MPINMVKDTIFIPVDQLVPDLRNPKIHGASKVKRVSKAIEAFGFNNPILIQSDRTIIAGHCRRLAALDMGLEKVPCIILDHLTEDEALAYLLADNKTQEGSDFDIDMEAQNIMGLHEAGIDLLSAGYSQSEIDLAIINASCNESGKDDIPKLKETAVSQQGDVFKLGRHRVICGDATSADDVSKLLGQIEPHLMVTDPPYGVNYDANWRNEAVRASGKVFGSRAIGKVQNDQRADWREAWALFPGEVAYVWHAGTYSHIVAESLIFSGFDIRTQIIWAKNRMAISRGHYHHKHEPCFYAVKNNGTGHWSGSRKETTLWQIDHQKSETGHSTQKPVECMRRPVVNNSSPGQVIYDPFLGSGTTIIACEMEGRACFGVEIDPLYVDLIVSRWETFTCQKAELLDQ